MAKSSFSKRAMLFNQATINKVINEYKTLAQMQRQNAEDIRNLTDKLSVDTKKTKGDSEKLRSGKKTLNALTTADYLRKVLAKVSYGLTISVLLERIEKIGWTTSNPASKYATVSGVLRKHPHLFKKTGPGQFMLFSEYLKLNQRMTKLKNIA